MDNLGIYLGGVGRLREALAAAEQAVVIWRELAEAEPDRYRPALASSLNSLGNYLGGVGRPWEALAAAEQAVVIWRGWRTLNLTATALTWLTR